MGLVEHRLAPVEELVEGPAHGLAALGEREGGEEGRADVEVGPFLVKWNTEANRVQIFSPRPSENMRKQQSQLMRGAGFKRSRREGCWQRMASVQAWHSANAAAKQLVALREDSQS